MLKEEIMEAAKAGKFTVYTVRTSMKVLKYLPACRREEEEQMEPTRKELSIT
jgi:hypothetical protein